MPEYYKLLLYIIFGILPSLIWLFYYLQKDIHPEPKKMILKVFLLGMLITMPTLFVQLGLISVLDKLQIFLPFIPQLVISLTKWFLIIALTEEFFKYSVVRFSVFGNKELDEPLDIMLYMVVAALGFAALENIFYLFSPINSVLSFNEVIKTTFLISFVRFIGATFLHTLCSALVGYFVALGSIRNYGKIKFTILGLFLATLLHGLYNFSIMTLAEPFNFLLPISIVGGLAIFMVYDFDEIRKIKGICKL